jgi:hypothetical protein
MSRLICYCFGYTEEDLCQDVLRHGRSLIMERILAEKKDGHCRCAEKNPSGHCCLGQVRQVVDAMLRTIA